MAFAAANARDSRQSDINITPLVDVMLVLLVLFIVTAPAVTRSLAIGLQPANAPPAVPLKPLHLYVGAGDVYTLDGEAIDRRSLAAKFAAIAATGGQAPVVEVSADPDADYQSVLQPMADARRAGMENLVLVNR